MTELRKSGSVNCQYIFQECHWLEVEKKWENINRVHNKEMVDNSIKIQQYLDNIIKLPDDVELEMHMRKL